MTISLFDIFDHRSLITDIDVSSAMVMNVDSVPIQTSIKPYTRPDGPPLSEVNIPPLVQNIEIGAILCESLYKRATKQKGLDTDRLLERGAFPTPVYPPKSPVRYS